MSMEDGEEAQPPGPYTVNLCTIERVSNTDCQLVSSIPPPMVPQNAAECRRMPQNAAECRRMPQNAAAFEKIPGDRRCLVATRTMALPMCLLVRGTRCPMLCCFAKYDTYFY